MLYATAWERLERALGQAFPPEVERQIEREWEAIGEAERGVLLGGFVAFAKRRTLEIAAAEEARKKGGGDGRAAPATPGGLESRSDAELAELQRQLRDVRRQRSIRQRRGQRIAGVLKPKLAEIRDRLRAEQKGLAEAIEVCEERLRTIEGWAREIAATGRVDLEEIPVWTRTVRGRRGGGDPSVVAVAKATPPGNLRRRPWTPEQRHESRIRTIRRNAERYRWPAERLAARLAEAEAKFGIGKRRGRGRA